MRAASTKKKLSETTSNLRVAVRVRPMNSFEREDKCTDITKVDKYKLSVNCKGKPFGPFFRVYDSDTTQSEVYEDLVASQIKKVIAGFNCTVFAYGQTGTGKTFTMEGGRTDVKSSKDDETTGIIPRAVEDIFEQLEASGCEEYSLRVSYIELYNEELFDLLATNTSSEDRQRIRIFDDQNKKGVIVSGVEEVPVRNRADVFKLLAAGAEKKKTAATLMNSSSSRSHSLFMVNVVVRENTINGEELVKQGKLNLVDLAGSENIGRSGAQGNRAKEAGSVNQSLLTLGRVIHLLATNSQHIPYRESKLTRLLQDSLGGSTITSLIATMSPASSNFEESQSTLEYAMRAANIKNKPVCNSKVSKKTILKEYSDEIEKLRRDLRAAREKNGVIISEESHEEFQRNTEKVRELEEQLDAAFVKMKRFMEDLLHMDDQYKKLFDRKDQLEERLKIRLMKIAEKEKELAVTKDELARHVKALESMHTAASNTFAQLEQTRKVAFDMKEDMSAYRMKVEEMKRVSDNNFIAAYQFVNETATTLLSFMDVNDIYKKSVRNEAGKILNSSGSPCKLFAELSSKVRSNSTRTTPIVLANNELLAECEKKMIEKVSEVGNDLKTLIKNHLRKFEESCTTIGKESNEYALKISKAMDIVTECVEEYGKSADPLITDLRTINNEKHSKIVDSFVDMKKKVTEGLSSIRKMITGADDTQKAIGSKMIEKTIDAAKFVEVSMNLIQNLMHGFETESSKTRCAFESEMNGLVEDNLKISPECESLSQEMKQKTDSIAESLKSLCNQFETSTNEISRKASENISNLKMEHIELPVDFREKVASYKLETQVSAIPKPEDLLNKYIKMNHSTDDPDGFLINHKDMSHRDSVFDESNKFLSPQTLKKKRELGN